MFLVVRLIVWFVLGSATLAMIERNPAGAWVLGIISTILTAWLAIDLYIHWPEIKAMIMNQSHYQYR
jgi:hypothetical protein